ncbi:MAG: COG3014 family protein [Planctomycetota bacterium]
MLPVVAALAVAWGSSGCAATYSERIDAARHWVAHGEYDGAVETMNEVLEVDSREELPPEWGSEAALAVLERAMLLMALGDYELSARDLSAAERELEYLDLVKDTPGKIAKYMYSESSEVYRVVPTEHLALNGTNMINYLAMGDLAGARVEARRLTVVRNYLDQAAPDRSHAPFFSYLAGFVFEHLGDFEEAMRYYDEALQGRTYETLRGPVARLAARTSYRGQAIERFLSKGPTPPSEKASSRQGDLLVLVGLGRVPFRVPVRDTVGASIGIAATLLTWGDTRILERSATKVVVYPRLVHSGSIARGAAVKLDGKQVPIELGESLAAAIQAEFEVLKPMIVAAALTRMATRAAAYEGARHAGRHVGGGGFGLLTGLLVEGVLVGLDEPDTRSWNFLPESWAVSRLRLPAGRHRVRLRGPPGDRAPVTYFRGIRVV